MKYTTSLLVLFTFFASSCSVSSRLKTSEKYVNRQAEASANDAKLINKPILADLEVSLVRAKTNYSVTNKEIGTSTMVLPNQGKSKSKGALLAGPDEYYKSEAKKRAQFQFMSEHKCDYLVDPIYLIETEAESNSDVVVIKVEIVAFPAVYKKFSQPDSLPKCITQINYADHRGIPLMIKSSETQVFDSKSKGFVLGFGASKIGDEFVSGTADAGLAGFFGYYSQKQLGQSISIRKEISLISRGTGYKYDFQEPIYDTIFGFQQIVGYNNRRREVKSRSVGLQIPLLLSYDASKFSVYLGPALNLDLAYIARTRNIGASVWESTTTAVDELDENQIAGLSMVLGASYWVTDNIAIGYRHDNSLRDWNWTSNNLSVSFKLK
jgi:hypothetical protein